MNIKKLMGIAVLLVALMSAGLMINLVQAVTEGIVNGGFEQGDGTGWTLYWSTVLSSVHAPPAVGAHSGDYVLKMVEVRITQAFATPVVPTSDLTVWVYGAHALYLQLKYADGSESVGIAPVGAFLNGQWNMLTYPILNTKAVSEINLLIGNEVAYVDDISMQVLETPVSVVPEAPLGTVVVAASMIAGLGAFIAIPKLRSKQIK